MHWDNINFAVNNQNILALTATEMNIYIISYDLRTPGRNYTPLYDAIKAYGDWQHPMESFWTISTDDDANVIFNKLSPNIDNNDSLFIIQMDLKDMQGWLPKSFWEWINKSKMNTGILNRPIITADSNAPLMSLCFSQGWCNRKEYITQRECNNVTPAMLKAANEKLKALTSFDELSMFHGITQIDGYTFSYCTSLKSVMLPAECTSIGAHSFDRCDALTELTLPKNVIRIEPEAFGNSGIQTLNIESALSEIGDSAFANMGKLTKVTTAVPVTKIGYRAFENCTAFSDKTIYANAGTIGSRAFNSTAMSGEIVSGTDNKLVLGTSDTDLTKYAIIGEFAVAAGENHTVTIGGTIKEIEANAIKDSSDITIILSDSSCLSGINWHSGAIDAPVSAIKMGDGGNTVDYILNTYGGQKRLVKCADTDTVVMPSDTEVLCTNSIQGSNIKTLTLNDGLKTIEDMAINTNSITEAFTIPSGCAIQGCPTTSEFWAQELHATVDGMTALVVSNKQAEGTYKIPDDVQLITSYAFNNTNKITAIDVNKASHFRQNAFVYMTALKRITFSVPFDCAAPLLGGEEPNLTEVVLNIADPHDITIDGDASDARENRFDVFGASPYNMYVPDASVESYKADSYFKRFSSKIKGISELE